MKLPLPLPEFIYTVKLHINNECVINDRFDTKELSFFFVRNELESKFNTENIEFTNKVIGDGEVDFAFDVKIDGVIDPSIHLTIIGLAEFISAEKMCERLDEFAKRLWNDEEHNITIDDVRLIVNASKKISEQNSEIMAILKEIDSEP
jgi:hypothetical protein